VEPRSLKYVADACEGVLSRGDPDRMVEALCTDSRRIKPGDVFFALSGPAFDGHRFLADAAQKNAAAVVGDRNKVADFTGCPVIAVDDPRAALGRLAKRYRSEMNPAVIAVGGSNGKTTTKELIASVLRQQMATLWSEASFNNDIGVPLSVLRLAPSHQAAVFEVGTNHPGELAPLLRMISPRFGVITTIGREHLEFFRDVPGVAHEQGFIGEALPADGRLFVNGDNGWTESLVRRTTAKVTRVGLNEGNDFRASNVRFDESGVTFWVSAQRSDWDGDYRINLMGRHQVTNALFAIALGAELDQVPG
jgi:UDP-N-acetylmuramoyl-tripeptide--D-alanyl-D-alanine ligase